MVPVPDCHFYFPCIKQVNPRLAQGRSEHRSVLPWVLFIRKKGTADTQAASIVIIKIVIVQFIVRIVRVSAKNMKFDGTIGYGIGADFYSARGNALRAKHFGSQQADKNSGSYLID